MIGLLPLVVFGFVSSVTPGPNNILLWGSGTAFGFRRTIPHIVGTATGLGTMALAVAAGLGVLIATVPQLQVVMKVVGSIYLLVLAYQIAGAHGLRRGDVSRPLGILQASAFQVINPKAWIFAVGAITTFRPTDLSGPGGAVVVALVMMAVVLPSAAIWAAGGEAMGRLIVGHGAERVVGVAMGALLAATVALVWI
jgi:threonine/homoserine/homoserine lactone efflux protein